MAYSDGVDFEHGILFASDERLASMVQTVEAIAAATLPEAVEPGIEEARRFIADQREEARADPDVEPEYDEYSGEMEEESPREEM